MNETVNEVYSKYKERSPKDTVFAIQKLLNEAGLFPMVKWIQTPYKGVYSNRVELYPSTFGTHGKGTDAVYCAASGFAELMERIQNNLISLCIHMQRDLRVKYGFASAPDEQNLPFEDLISKENLILNRMLDCFGFLSEPQKILYLQTIAESTYGQADGKIPSIPFAHLGGNRIEWVPTIMLMYVYGSNGMAAGNTMDEAMVQAMAEIFERHASGALILGKVTPPRIPDEYLQKCGVWPLIQELREGGRFDIDIYDSTMGKGYPVVFSVITNRKTGGFALKHGSHPSFEVAVERTLTEAMQGRERIETATRNVRLDSQEVASYFHNPVNVSKVGIGVYPTTMFLREPDWEFKPWTEWEGLDNAGFLKRMISLVADQGYEIFVRDASHMGFPTCQIIIPGFSGMYPETPIHMRSLQTGFRILNSAGHFPDMTPEEEDRLLRYIRFKENSFLENKLDTIMARSVRGKRMNSWRVAAFLAFKHGDFSTACHFFEAMTHWVENLDEDDLHLLEVRREYLRYRIIGHSHEEAAKLIRRCFEAEVADRVAEEMSDPETVMQRVFPHVSCPDCAHCELNDKECNGAADNEVLDKIYAALKGTKVKQEDILKHVRELAGME